MGKVTRVKDWLSLPDLKVMVRKADNADKRMRWQIIYTTAADPRDGTTISLQLGCSRWLVTDAVSEYNRLGSKAFGGPGSGHGRSNFHMDYQQEVKFLSKFVNRARRGLVTTTGEIHRGFEKEIGKKVRDSVVSRLLKRHKWRKLEPRPEHPKKNKQKQEVFKKTSPAWFPPQ
jgi:transposase